MAKETIQNIREAELKAKELVKDAEAQKASILEQAKADGAAIKKEILDEYHCSIPGKSKGQKRRSDQSGHFRDRIISTI